jgi:predicted metal-dependent hydrolase
MQEVELASIQTPSGDVSFKEAKLIIECKLTQIMTAYLEDFYSQEAKDYLKDVYKEESNYRKYVFGEITNVWVKNNKRSSRKSASSVF